MADKGKDKTAPAKGDKKEAEAKAKSAQPKDEVGTRKGCSRYQWELKDSNKDFWGLGHALVKLISLGSIIAAMAYFETTTVHPILTLILTMEASIIVFFIVLNTFAIQRYLPFILWPVSDLLNDLCCCGFLIGGIVFAVKSRRTMPLEYIIAVVLMGVAAFFALIDVCLQRKHFKGKRLQRNMLVPPPGKEKPPGAPEKDDAKKGKDAGKDKGKGKK